MTELSNLIEEYVERTQPNCPRCKYTLTSAKDARCSECGHELSLELAQSRLVAFRFTRLILIWAILISLAVVAGAASISWDAYQVVADMSRQMGQAPQPFLHWMVSSGEGFLIVLAAAAHALPALALLAWLLAVRKRLSSASFVRWSMRMCAAVLLFHVFISVVVFF